MPVLTPGDGLDVSRRAKSRRRFLTAKLGPRDLSVLEIGALDNPTFLANETGVRFADFFSRQESVERHRDAANHTWDRIVEVDYILRDTTLRDAVTEPPDLVIANHVIEHIPDPIGWFDDLRAIVAEDARIFLSVPDRRYTFDYFRGPTDAVDWLRAHDEKLAMPSYYQILRHLFFWTNLREADAWSGNVPQTYDRYSLEDAMARAGRLAESYTDVHCSVFTSASFATLLRDLASLLPWRIESLADPLDGENEFRLILRPA